MNNGKRYSVENKQKAKALRMQGLTHREIAGRLKAGLGSVFLWTKGASVTEKQKTAIEKRRNRNSLTFGIKERRSLAIKNLAPFWKSRPTNQDLLQRIRDFFKKYERIPLKREFNNTYKEYRKRFGSWNNAIKLSGFDPNPELFSKKFIANDGDKCDSFAEKIIDDWLFKNRVAHRRHVLYCGTKMTADFAVESVRIEYFGLAGESKLYDKRIRRKKEICKKQGLNLIEVYPKDLFSRNFKKCLGEILKASIINKR
jgi:hypothetical protein